VKPEDICDSGKPTPIYCAIAPKSSMKNAIEIEVINTAEQIGGLVDWLVFRHAPPVPYSPTIYIDPERIDLCREGSLSIITLLIDTGIPTRRAYLVDVHILGAQAFNTSGVKQKTLKDILRDEKIPKVFFDVRNDSDALFAHFGVALQGVEDVQLMESATRRTTASRKFLSGLAKCAEKNVLLSGSDLASWKQVKEKGERLFKAEYGGSYEVFNQRPILDDIISYCVGDVHYLPELRDKFWKTQAFRWRGLVNEESMKRVSASQKPEYQRHGSDREVAPWNEDQNRTLDQWNYMPPRDYFDKAFDSNEDWYDDWDNNKTWGFEITWELL
jgi:exonuclease 3'-5' domain-containing protein 1